jgi:RNA-directed DNA polymerase
VALSVLDEDLAGGQAGRVERRKRRRHGLANYRLIRYADDFVVMVAGTRAHAEALVDQAAVVLAPMGLRLSATKTQVVHLDEGFDFLGWHIQRRRKRGTDRVCVYTYPSKKALAAIIDTVRALTRRSRFRQLSTLLDRLNPVLRGWCAYFRHGGELAAQATPGRVVGVAAAPLPARLAAHHTRREHVVQPRHGHGCPVSLPGNAHPDTMDNHPATAG